MEETHHHEGGHNHETHHTHKSTTSKLKAHAGSLEAWLLPIFSSAPHIPQGGRKVIADIIPWLSLIFGVLGIIGLLGAGFIGVLLHPLLALGAGVRGFGVFITILLGLVSSIFSVLAFKPLQEFKKEGWNYCFYSFIVSTISAGVSILFMYSGIGNIIGVIIGAYILFEIRERYH